MGLTLRGKIFTSSLFISRKILFSNLKKCCRSVKINVYFYRNKSRFCPVKWKSRKSVLILEHVGCDIYKCQVHSSLIITLNVTRPLQYANMNYQKYFNSFVCVLFRCGPVKFLLNTVKIALNSRKLLLPVIMTC